MHRGAGLARSIGRAAGDGAHREGAEEFSERPPLGGLETRRQAERSAFFACMYRAKLAVVSIFLRSVMSRPVMNMPSSPRAGRRSHSKHLYVPSLHLSENSIGFASATRRVFTSISAGACSPRSMSLVSGFPNSIARGYP